MKYLLFSLLTACALFAIDLDGLRNDPNLEHRAHAAMDAAAESFRQAKSAYAGADVEKTARDLKEMQAAVELAQEALVATGKDPRRHVKPFKLAETESRELLRNVEGLENAMDIDDRKVIAGPKAKLLEVHDQWLEEIISGRR